jgi:hypothetical protein
MSDCLSWTRSVDGKAKVQMVHHAATWMLLGVMLTDTEWVRGTTVELLGAVDLTDWFYYFFMAIEEEPWRTVCQGFFCVVWLLRRVMIFGEGDWGWYAIETLKQFGSSGDRVV